MKDFYYCCLKKNRDMVIAILDEMEIIKNGPIKIYISSKENQVNFRFKATDEELLKLLKLLNTIK